MAADGAGAMGLPSSNRGVSGFRKPDDFNVLVDWFAASVDLEAVLREQGAIDADDDDRKRLLDGCDDGTTALEVAAHVFAFFFAGSDLRLSDEAGRGRFYKSRVPVTDVSGTYVGLIEMGGPHTIRQDGVFTCRLELSGDGCRLLEQAGSGHAKRWLELRAKLEACSGRLTRCDVAVDDLHGVYPIRVCMEWLEAGAFDNRGQKVKRQLINDFDSGDGKTLYIGSRTSEKFMRVYEKGREKGDPSSEWVRYEAQFKASRRKELPLDMLRDPAAYLLGAYPVLRFIRAVATRIEISNADAAATWKSARRHLKRQYGATLRFVLKHTPDAESAVRVIESLTSPKLPAWAGSDAANQWPEIVAVNRGNEQ